MLRFIYFIINIILCIFQAQLSYAPLDSPKSDAAAAAVPNPANFYSKPFSNEQLQLYPLLHDLNDYMGLNLTSSEVEHLRSNALSEYQQNQSSNSGMIAPVSGSSLGLQRAQVTHGLREVILCKDQKGKIGLRVKAMNKVGYDIMVN